MKFVNEKMLTAKMNTQPNKRIPKCKPNEQKNEYTQIIGAVMQKFKMDFVVTILFCFWFRIALHSHQFLDSSSMLMFHLLLFTQLRNK